MDKKPKVHARVDRLTFQQWLDEKKWLQQDFAAALAKELGRKSYALGALSRKLTGHRRFTAKEANATARVFGKPLVEVMAVLGVADPIPEAGTIDVTGSVTGAPLPHAKRQVFVFRTDDAWEGARAVTELAASLGRGIYVLRCKAGTFLRQSFGTPGGIAILAPVFGGGKVENVDVSDIEWQARVVAVNFK